MNKFQLVNCLHKKYKKAFLYAKETKLLNIDLDDFPFPELLLTNVSSHNDFCSKNLTLGNLEYHSNVLINLSYHSGTENDDLILLYVECDEEDNKEQSSIIQILYTMNSGIKIIFRQRKTSGVKFTTEEYCIDKDITTNCIFDYDDIVMLSLENDFPIVDGYDFILEDSYERY